MELIVAITENNVIGNGGDMPWHLPVDLARFKKITTGNTIVMGRRTWDSIGRALPDRLNVVLTRQKDFVAEGAVVIRGFEELHHLETTGIVFIIGGGELYKQSLQFVDKLHVTQIHTTIDGDTFFPQINEAMWQCVETEHCPKNDRNPFDVTFQTWVKSK
jgi:dihydrofolate reductase